MAPNILYLHSHDTGRHVQPYGAGVRTPRIQRLAEEGVVYRQAFAAAPTCSGSRAALATGQYPHVNGMIGLAHRGFGIHDMRRHLIHALRPAGYYTVLVGEQHIAGPPVRHRLRPAAHGRHAAPRGRRRARPWPSSCATASRSPSSSPSASSRRTAASSIPPRRRTRTGARRRRASRTRRRPARTWRRSRPAQRSSTAASASSWTPSRAPGSTATRSSSAPRTTACPFPGAKATLTDRGTGVMLILRGPGGFRGGKAVDAMVQHLDVYPTVCELAGVETPAHVQGRSLLPLMRGETRQVRDELFTEMTYHAAYDPQRAVRTRRWKYIRRYGDLAASGARERRRQPDQGRAAGGRLGRVDRAARGPARPAARPRRGRQPRRATPPTRTCWRTCARRLDRWMEETDDPLRHGDVPAPPGAEYNTADQRSAGEPAVRV